MDTTEIAFFDVETSVPVAKGQKYALLEFGAILVCSRRLVELQSYSTLIRPIDLSVVSAASVRCNGISRDSLSTAPAFDEIADAVYNLLHGRVWAGHNIVRFDCLRIREAFAEIGRPVPEPKGIIDSLQLLTRTFGRRAGNMKMATLASYFGLGKQTHRSLDDVRMNLEVVKYCATVLFLESSLPDMLTMSTPEAKTRNNVGETSCPQDGGQSSLASVREETPTLFSSVDVQKVSVPSVSKNPFDLSCLIDQMRTDITTTDTMLVDGRPLPCTPEMPTNVVSMPEGSRSPKFLKPHEVSSSSLSASLVPSIGGCKRITLLHDGVPLCIHGVNMKVRFGVSPKFLDTAGRPRLNIVVEPSATLCEILDRCDQLGKQQSTDAGSDSEWRTVVFRKNGFGNFSPTIRLHIPIETNVQNGIYTTEIYKQDSRGTQKLVFTKVDVSELESIFFAGALVDAHFSLDLYDYQQYAGIRLVAKRLCLFSGSSPPTSQKHANAEAVA